MDDASPTLLVEQLAKLCGPDSRILITRQNPSFGAFAIGTNTAESTIAMTRRQRRSIYRMRPFRVDLMGTGPTEKDMTRAIKAWRHGCDVPAVSQMAALAYAWLGDGADV